MVDNLTFNNFTDKNNEDSTDSIDFNLLTYKDTKVLSSFISDQGKILPRRVTGLSSKQQKKVTKLIKTSRIAALLPFVVGKG
jgi:small subunit ribosomal protein S18